MSLENQGTKRRENRQNNLKANTSSNLLNINIHV